jgi:hypothetical protein
MYVCKLNMCVIISPTTSDRILKKIWLNHQDSNLESFS